MDLRSWRSHPTSRRLPISRRIRKRVCANNVCRLFPETSYESALRVRQCSGSTLLPLWGLQFRNSGIACAEAQSTKLIRKSLFAKAFSLSHGAGDFETICLLCAVRYQKRDVHSLSRNILFADSKPAEILRRAPLSAIT